MDAVEQKQPGTALTVQERASLALGAREHEIKLRELAAQATEIVAIRDKVSYDQVHGTRMSLKRARIAIEGSGKTAREDAQAFAKAVIQEERRLIAIIEPEEGRLQALQDAHDAEIARQREEAARRERERIERIQASIADIRGTLINVAGRSSEVIDAKVKEIVALEITDATHQEFAAEAEQARGDVLGRLREMHAAMVSAEAEAARIRAERAELERQKAEQAERERVEAERRATEQRKADEAAAAERARIAAEEQAARDRIAQQDREARELREAEEREIQAKRDRIAAEERALEERQRQEREAREARERDERMAREEAERQERLAAEQREGEAREARERAERETREAEAAEQRRRDDEARQKREAAEAAAREQREREEAEARAREDAIREEKRQANELLDGREMLTTFVHRFGHRDEFAPVLKAIDAFFNPKPARAKRTAAAAS